METKLYLYGGSGHCKVIIDIIEAGGGKVTAIIDDNPRTNDVFGIPVIPLSEFGEGDKLILSVGNNRTRRRLSEIKNSTFDRAIHPAAIISSRSVLGEGTVVMAGVIVNPDSVVGKHCILNTGSIIEHDASIADFVHISPGASLAGNVTVGEGSHIGIGATVIQGIKIGKWATVGAGAVVIRDIPDYAVAVGNPCRVLKFNEHVE